jgi:hypothetical protein
MSSPVGIKRRYPNHAMNAVFGFQITICIRTGYGKGDIFYPRLIPGQMIDDLDLHFFGFRPPEIKPEQHFHPVLGFRASCTCVYGYNSISFIVFISEQRLELLSVYFLFQAG